MRPLVAHCHLGLCKLYRRMGKHVQAREHLATATALYREMGMPYWVGAGGGRRVMRAALEALRGGSARIAAIRAQVDQLLGRQARARRVPPILILGETGTGKRAPGSRARGRADREAAG